MNTLLTSARHEVLCTLRARVALLLLVVFLGMVSLSSLIGWITNTTVTRVYAKILADGLTTAPNPFAGVSSLYYSRNSVIYVVLIGALMAIILGVQATLRDRKSATTDLVLSRPVNIVLRLAGQFLGLGAVIASVLAASTVISWASISVIVGAPLGIDPTLRLVGFAALSWVLMMIFALLGMLTGLYSRKETTALLVPFVIWSAVAFVLPQIGTAARPVALLNPVAALAPSDSTSFDLVGAITGPFAITEQFKRAASIVLRDDSVTGSPLASIVLLVSVLIAIAWVVVVTPRRTLRSGLNE
ncbi:MAG: ABC transporter permease [Cryobacterium sp.]|uniref:ABC transporter permease n=1 Tax=unclassified Cryobacterium TaxID=2649013 RepID=UPI0018C93760|nr:MULTISPECIES: ABC transporter permease [unclassified Cryobacterium]MCY7403731.1 ABC transporter permease [Cryobacterium sp.]MEC5155575.1 ABC-2 type transport system permease protein [Cryobacterium sp. CAN_C3]